MYALDYRPISSPLNFACHALEHIEKRCERARDDETRHTEVRETREILEMRNDMQTIYWSTEALE